MKSLVAGLTGLVGQVTLEIEHLALAADLVGDELAAELCRGDVVGLDQADEVASGRGGVDGDDRDASVIGCLDAGHDAGRIDRAQDDAVVLLGDGVLHLTDLIGDAAGGRQGEGIDRDPVLRGAGLDRLLHRLPRTGYQGRPA